LNPVGALHHVICPYVRSAVIMTVARVS
jgi:hypothetical protein